jgi:glycosyltransferase involved in cell wall biosynthesis
MIKPTLSVGLPVYNAERYLCFALDSLLSQDLEDFELIISDNGSTDGTTELCRAYADRDKRIRYFRGESNRGATWNFRRVLELAEGKYFRWAAHDDECYPAMSRRCVEVLEQSDQSVSLVYPWFEFIDEHGSVIELPISSHWDHVHTTAASPHQRLAHVLRHLLFCSSIYGVARLNFLRLTRPYGTIAPDWVLVAELAMLGKIIEVPEVLFRYRRHEDNCAVANKSWSELLAWHDPTRKTRTLLPYDLAIVQEYLKSIHHLPLSPLEKIICFALASSIHPWRKLWLGILKLSGPARIRLRTMTGWHWLSRRGTELK